MRIINWFGTMKNIEKNRLIEQHNSLPTPSCIPIFSLFVVITMVCIVSAGNIQIAFLLEN